MVQQFTLLYGTSVTAPRGEKEPWTGYVRLSWNTKEVRLAVEAETGEEVTNKLLEAAQDYVKAHGWPAIR